MDETSASAGRPEAMGGLVETSRFRPFLWQFGDPLL